MNFAVLAEPCTFQQLEWQWVHWPGHISALCMLMLAGEAGTVRWLRTAAHGSQKYRVTIKGIA
jgi:hypothetical protein